MAHPSHPSPGATQALSRSTQTDPDHVTRVIREPKEEDQSDDRLQIDQPPEPTGKRQAVRIFGKDLPAPVLAAELLFPILGLLLGMTI